MENISLKTTLRCCPLSLVTALQPSWSRVCLPLTSYEMRSRVSLDCISMFPSRESPPLKYTASFLFLSHTSQQQVDAIELGRIGGVDAAHRHAKQLQRERGGGEQHEVAHGRECEFGRRRQ